MPAVQDSYDLIAKALAAGGYLIQVDSLGNLTFFSGSTKVAFFDSTNNQDFRIASPANLRLGGKISLYNGIAPVGFGLAPIYGLDNRSGITVVDGAPITLYAVPVGANQLFDAAIEIDATAFTSGTATYTLTYTQNGVSQTMVVTATVINTVTGIRRLIQPDASTLVTIQLTGVFVATVRISAALMQLA